MNIVDLNKLTQTGISDIYDPLFIQDVSKSETKLLVSSDLGKYILSSSNLIVSLKSGSFTGSFYGNLNGISTTSSISFLSKYSNNSKYLNYPNYSTSSYSLFSISSSKSNNSFRIISSSHSVSSSNSITSSYANTWIIGNALTSSVSKLSSLSLYSTSSNYLIYSDKDNGKIYKSIISEYSPTASIGVSLIGNKIIDGILVNDSTAARSYSSSFANNSTTARYIKEVDNSEKSSFAINTDLVPFAYINFKINHNNGKDWKFEVNQYKNIATPGVGIASLPDINDSIAIFTGSYHFRPNPSKENDEENDEEKTATILAETNFNFPFDTFVNYWFTTFAFPIGIDKFAIAVRVGQIPSERFADTNLDNVLFNLLDGASISAVMYTNVTGVSTPSEIIKSTQLNASSVLEGCARL